MVDIRANGLTKVAGVIIGFWTPFQIRVLGLWCSSGEDFTSSAVWDKQSMREARSDESSVMGFLWTWVSGGFNVASSDLGNANLM